MKNLSIVFMLLFFVGTVSTVNAQKKDIIINEISEYMSQGNQAGFEIAILDSEPKDVEAFWIKEMKKVKAKVHNSKKSTEIFADNANIPQISGNTVDIYAVTAKTSYGTRFTVFVDLGGVFLSSTEHAVAHGQFEEYLRSLAHEESKRVISEELKSQEKHLESLNKNLDGLLKDKDKYLSDIEKAKELISQRESNIAENEKLQETKRQQIAIQQEIIEVVRQKHTDIHKD